MHYTVCALFLLPILYSTYHLLPPNHISLIRPCPGLDHQLLQLSKIHWYNSNSHVIESLQVASPLDVRLEFWRQVNATWLFVIDSILKSKVLKKNDWMVVCETIVAVGNVLALYGLVDFPLGFSEYEILSCICERFDEFDE